ncbi:MAG: MFS transporter [Sedimentisphaerales bacterium]|jgi:dipeptide/tripeptide permease|nr:MFS transporter [Sedimentisphaerales bacterium]
MQRTRFPAVFWVANAIEVLERFAYYGIYMGFGIYMEYLGYSRDQLGIIQSLFLLLSYMIPVFSGTFADRYGFKKVLIVSYLAYLPSILLLLLTRSFSGIALTMLSIGLAAGIFKPLIAGTIRAVTDASNKTLGFGVFYAMVNVGATFGPIAAGRLRAISWAYAFLAAAVAICLMLIITIIFYKEPPRRLQPVSTASKLREIYVALSDLRFSIFLCLLGVFFWMPFWSFFNLLAVYIDANLDTARLYNQIQSVLGTSVADFFSRVDQYGTRRILGETVSHDGYIIMICQVLVSSLIQAARPIPAFLVGLAIAALGFVVIGTAATLTPWLVFIGITLFAIGEMITSPRIQEYITWLAPKEKAGLYMGSNFLATGIGGFASGIYTSIYGHVEKAGHPEYIWYILACHLLIGIAAIYLFTKLAGQFTERQE